MPADRWRLALEAFRTAFIQRLTAAPLRSTSMGGRAVAVDADKDKLLSARGVALDDRLLQFAVVNAKHQFVLAA